MSLSRHRNITFSIDEASLALVIAGHLDPEDSRARWTDEAKALIYKCRDARTAADNGNASIKLRRR